MSNQINIKVGDARLDIDTSDFGGRWQPEDTVRAAEKAFRAMAVDNADHEWWADQMEGILVARAEELEERKARIEQHNSRK